MKTSLRRIYTLLTHAVVAAMLPWLSSCADEPLDYPSACPEGEAAEITLTVDAGSFRQITRGDMTPGLDSKVTDIWIAVYNKRNGLRTGMVRLENLDESLDHTSFREVTLSTLSGESHIVGVANYTHRYASTEDSGKLTPLSDALENADTWEKYTAISVAFDNQGNCVTAAPINSLVMSGTYTASAHADGSYFPEETVSIYPGMSRLSGAVHLRRMISQVKFEVTYNTSNIKSFEITSWRVVNLPTHAWLAERSDNPPANAVDARPAATTTLFNTERLKEFTERSTTGWHFDWWQLENKRTGLPADYSSLSATEAYSRRELQHKNADGSNTGRFVSLVEPDASDLSNNSATYVVMSVEMEMNVDENGKPVADAGLNHRLVQTEYTVHLGYAEGSGSDRVRDFNCRRNSAYTYRVTVNNVDDLLVEARQDNERNPAVEGFVSDISAEFFEIDAHYNCMNIYLSQEDIDNFQFFMSVPTTDGRQLTINSMHPETIPAPASPDYPYLSWIELRAAQSQSRLEAYVPRKGANSDGKTYTVDQISSQQGFKPGYYTMFVNEYVYEPNETQLNPEDSGYGDESTSLAWRDYVNKPPRRAWLNVSGDVSADGKSVYYKSKYAISQASIQTYYNNSAHSGLGVEHANESYGLTLRNTYNPYRTTSGTYPDRGRNSHAGRFNLAQYITGGTGSSLTWRDNYYSWSAYLDVNTRQSVNAINNQNISRDARTEPLPSIIGSSSLANAERSLTNVLRLDPDYGQPNRKYIEAITACMNRNRDNDGDGRIDANELRWYIPTAEQYVRIILGRLSLEHPMLDPVGLVRLPNNSGTLNDQNSSLMAYASNGKQIWMMEGVSDSEYRQWPAQMGTPWQVRCVRKLGADNSHISSVPDNEPAFELRDGTNIVDMKYYDQKSVRLQAVTGSAGLPPHHINDQRYNRCFRSFEFADEVIGFNDSRLGISGTTIEWSSYLRSANPCRVLNTAAKSGWRVPNQKELTIIAILGKSAYGTVPSGNVYQVSSTYSFFDFSGYVPGMDPSDPTPGGSINSAYRFPMKIITSSGASTQAEPINNLYVNNNYFGIRCVRDVME